jgi:hypothetical protein
MFGVIGFSGIQRTDGRVLEFRGYREDLQHE